MSENIIDIQDRVLPVRVHDKKTGIAYELDFSRESVRAAESRGFETGDIAKYPASKIPEFFYYAFRKNHKNVARSQTDSLLERMGGMTTPMLATHSNRRFSCKGIFCVSGRFFGADFGFHDGSVDSDDIFIAMGFCFLHGI